MKRLIFPVLLILLYSVPSFAQGGLIGLFVDPWGNICDIVDHCDVEIVDVLVVHKDAPGATAAEFAIEASSGFTGIYLGEEISASLPTGACIGNSQRGIAIAYGKCLYSPIHILTIRYLLCGTSEPNSYLQVVADPRALPEPGIWMADCAWPPLLHPALGGRAYFNNDGSVVCSEIPTRTRPTSWGQIKALYRD